MLDRLGHDAVVRGDHHQVEVDPRGPGDHRAHEALVAGHVDDGQAPPARERELRVAEGDRDAARLLLGQAVGVDARERGDQRGLAVVDVARRAEGQRGALGPGAHPRAARTTRAATSASSSVSVRGSSRRRPSWMRPTSGGSPARRAAASASAPGGAGVERDRGALQVEQRQRAAAHPGDAVDHVPAGLLGEATGAGGEGRRVGVEHREHRDRRPRVGGVAVEAERRLERRERQLVDPHRAGERVAAAGGDGVALADEQPGLRAAEELVAREADDGRAGAHRAAHGGLVGERGQVVGQDARADVVDHGDAQAAERLDLDLLDEADRAEVRRVGAQERRGVGRDRPRVVGQPRTVRRADLDHPRAGLGHDLGDPERAADLDELPARDDELAPGGEGGRRQERRGRAVVDRERRVGAGELAQQPFDVVLAGPALAVLEAVLEVRVALSRARDGRPGLVGERRAAEVRVDDHAGRVEHAPQRRPQPPPRALDEVDVRVGRRAAQELRAALGELGPRDRRRQAVDGRQRAQRSAGVRRRCRALGHRAAMFANPAARRRSRRLLASSGALDRARGAGRAAYPDRSSTSVSPSTINEIPVTSEAIAITGNRTAQMPRRPLPSNE